MFKTKQKEVCVVFRGAYNWKKGDTAEELVGVFSVADFNTVMKVIAGCMTKEIGKIPDGIEIDELAYRGDAVQISWMDKDSNVQYYVIEYVKPNKVYHEFKRKLESKKPESV